MAKTDAITPYRLGVIHLREIRRPMNQLKYKIIKLEFGPMPAQRGRRPAEYKWRPLFNAAKFG